LHSFWPLQQDFSPAALGVSALAGEPAGWLLLPQPSAPNTKPAPAAANTALEIPFFIEFSFQSQPPALGGGFAYVIGARWLQPATASERSELYVREQAVPDPVAKSIREFQLQSRIWGVEIPERSGKHLS
jgi:hypothetical protein